MDKRLQGSDGYLKHGGERSRWLKAESRQEGRMLLAALLEEDNGSVPSPLKFLALAAMGVSSSSFFRPPVCSPAQYLHVNTIKVHAGRWYYKGGDPPVRICKPAAPEKRPSRASALASTDPHYGGRPGRGREMNAPSVNRPDSQMPHRIIPWHRVHTIGRGPGGSIVSAAPSMMLSRGVWNRPIPIPHRSMTSGQTRSAQIRSPAAGVGA
ncbi:hypothetical protein MYCTH_2129775 [Thermothelomyces thermophilus ATCC 42464]|uniref:Uncharacterized protein n=1 Tax=Thermothelomyces thermophilus (strain ATCC 42464 / BCRC 31852 / DSM 1799) TaxID=573729 RepID=G2QL16_THET4|nr:uncharacterized protein MYCTH_2129775 [Thermothelomyces thermophilus ATCC 42464]AEO60648.1 hypothetical protein MYCTH_2129775 [Thermothelomyces thermophilus ATCC 42464]